MLKKRAIYTVKILLVCFILFSLHSIDSYAQDSEIGSITLYSHFNADNGSVQIEKDCFRIIKIADDADGHYMNKPLFSSFPAYTDEMKASDKKELASDLENYILRGKIAFDDEKSSNKNGYTVFRNLDRGVYLITQDRQNSSAQKQYRTNPFLISVPIVSDGKTIYDIYAEPKYTEGEGGKGEPQKQDKPSRPKTSDETDSDFWILLTGVSLLAMTVLAAPKRKRI